MKVIMSRATGSPPSWWCREELTNRNGVAAWRRVMALADNSAAPRPSSICRPARRPHDREQDNFFAAVAHGDTIRPRPRRSIRAAAPCLANRITPRRRQARGIVTPDALVLPAKR